MLWQLHGICHCMGLSVERVNWEQVSQLPSHVPGGSETPHPAWAGGWGAKHQRSLHPALHLGVAPLLEPPRAACPCAAILAGQNAPSCPSAVGDNWKCSPNHELRAALLKWPSGLIKY